jgi:hypothetical protein
VERVHTDTKSVARCRVDTKFTLPVCRPWSSPFVRSPVRPYTRSGRVDVTAVVCGDRGGGRREDGRERELSRDDEGHGVMGCDVCHDVSQIATQSRPLAYTAAGSQNKAG